MECFVEQGTSYRDCLGKIVAKYGPRVTVVRQRSIRMGGIFGGLFSREGVELEFYIPPVLNRNAAGSQVYQGGSVSGLSLQPGPYKGSAPAPLDFEEEKKKILAANGRDSTQQTILNEVREIKEKLEAGAGDGEHPNLSRVKEILRANDFSDSYIKGIIDRARGELPLDLLENFEALEEKTLEWIGESISIYRGNSPQANRILVLVGPTGVGKTTTVAKLAAVFGYKKNPPLAVRLITIDAFRIGAKAQIEAYGDIMGFPVSYVDNYRDLKKEIVLYSEETDIILVDTIGKSPKDAKNLGEMKEVLDACGPRAEVYLVLSAGTKTSDLGEILRHFEPFNYRSVVLTKLDETSHLGNVISILSEKGKAVSYITDGQKVPDDIKKARVIHFLINLDDFKVDREKMEKRFSLEEDDQFQWG
ncbi:MAG: flagellar biosynthesis protein FlhF [Treponema sp.]|jgi:flagellar biosynthesis protein FlhF|nr:flagellar biosynthesis protein FlhF [Treponema sp.]